MANLDKASWVEYLVAADAGAKRHGAAWCEPLAGYLEKCGLNSADDLPGLVLEDLPSEGKPDAVPHPISNIDCAHVSRVLS